MSCVYSSLNFSTLEHDQENQLCEYMWTPLRTQYRVFFIFSLNFFLTALMGIHMNFHVAIKAQCCLGFNLLPHGMCLTREQMGLCTINMLNIKSLKAVLTTQLTLQMNFSLHALLSFSQSTTPQDKPLAKLNT